MESLPAALGLTSRHVSIVELDGRPARRTLMSRTYPTDADDLWDALTNPQRIPRWFLPIDGDLRLGGSYQLHGNAGGTVLECDAPRRFRVTWGMGGDPTWLTITLQAAGTGTSLQLEHVGYVPPELWEQFGPSATGIGWDGALHGLTIHLATGAAITPAEAAAWMTSADGAAFMQESGRLWELVDVQAGATPDAARLRAGRTVAMYTGQPDPGRPDPAQPDPIGN